MRSALPVTIGLCFLTGGLALTSQVAFPRPGAAIEQKLTELCATSEKTDALEQEALKTHTSPALEKALLSSKTLWAFVIDPETTYQDRMAAATRGASALSPEDLHLLWDAMAEVETLPTGMTAPPCDYLRSAQVRPDMWVTGRSLPSGATLQVVLGREIRMPDKKADFPVTAEERERSPWLWQLARALPILFDNVNRYYGDAGRYPLRVKAAWDWPIPVPTKGPEYAQDSLALATWERIFIRSRALTQWAPHDVLLLRSVLRMALDNGNRLVSDGSNVEALQAWGKDSYHFEELAHAGQIVILEKTKWVDLAGQVAFQVAQLARSETSPYAPHLVPMKTATAILAIGRWATDGNIDPWTRYQFVGSICKIVDDPSCAAGELREPEDPKLSEEMKSFEAWFEKMRPSLEQQAAAERPRLQALATELGVELE
jgi:hypothetical protein